MVTRISGWLDIGGLTRLVKSFMGNTEVWLYEKSKRKIDLILFDVCMLAFGWLVVGIYFGFD